MFSQNTEISENGIVSSNSNGCGSVSYCLSQAQDSADHEFTAVDAPRYALVDPTVGCCVSSVRVSTGTLCNDPLLLCSVGTESCDVEPAETSGASVRVGQGVPRYASSCFKKARTSRQVFQEGSTEKEVIDLTGDEYQSPVRMLPVTSDVIDLSGDSPVTVVPPSPIAMESIGPLDLSFLTEVDQPDRVPSYPVGTADYSNGLSDNTTVESASIVDCVDLLLMLSDNTTVETW